MSWPFSLGETFDGVLTLASLITIIFTARAAQSAAVSAKITKEQFVLNKEQYERQKLPRLLPIEQSYTRERISLQTSFDSYDYIDNGVGDLNIHITNVGIGDAYSLESGMTVSNIEEITLQNTLHSSYSYNVLVNQQYTLDFKIEDKFHHIKFENRIPHSERPYTHTFYIKDQINYQTVLHSKEAFSVGISSATQILLLDYIYRSLQKLDETELYVKPNIEVFIKYKTEAQLSTTEHEINRYELVVKDADIDNYGRVSFRLEFFLK